MAPGTRTLNGRKLPGGYAGLLRDQNIELPIFTAEQLKAVFCLPATGGAEGKDQTKEHRSKAFNAVVQRCPCSAAKRASGGGPSGPERTGTNCYAFRANIRMNMATKRAKLRPFNAAKHTDLYFCGFFRNKINSTAGHRK